MTLKLTMTTLFQSSGAEKFSGENLKKAYGRSGSHKSRTRITSALREKESMRKSSQLSWFPIRSKVVVKIKASACFQWTVEPSAYFRTLPTLAWTLTGWAYKTGTKLWPRHIHSLTLLIMWRTLQVHFKLLSMMMPWNGWTPTTAISTSQELMSAVLSNLNMKQARPLATHVLVSKSLKPVVHSTPYSTGQLTQL